jgi:translocation and assembly module TamB
MRKSLKITAGVLAALLLMASMTIGWLCYTQSGLSFALKQLNLVGSLHIEVSGVEGRLAGPLHIEKFLLDHNSVHIEAEQIDIDLTPALLMGGVIAVNQVRIGNVTVQYKQQERVTPEQPIHFLPAFLRLSVKELNIVRGEYRHSNGYVLKVLSARTQAQMTRHRIALNALDAHTTDFDATGNAQIDSDTLLSLSGTLQAVYRVPGGVVLKADVQGRGPVTGSSRQLSLQVQLREPHQLSSTAVLSFAENGWQLQGDAQAKQIMLGVWWRSPAFHLENLSGHYQLNQDGMHYQVDAVVPEWSPVLLHLDADTRYANKVFTLDRADVSVPATGVTSHTNGTITIAAGAPQLDLHTTWREFRWPLHLAADKALMRSEQGQLSLRGSGPYDYHLQTKLAHQRWPGGDLTAEGSLRTGTASELKVAAYRLQTLKGNVSGVASLGLRQPYPFSATINASSISPSELFADWPGSINATAQINGRIGSSNSQAIDLRVNQLGGKLRSSDIGGSGHVQYQSQGKTVSWRASDVALRWGRNQLRASGKMQTGNAAQQRLQVEVNAPDLAVLSSELSGDLSGTAQFASQAGDMSLQLRITSTQLAWQGWQLQQAQLRTQIDIDDKTPSSLDFQANRLSRNMMALQNVHLNGNGLLANHQISLTANPESDLLPDNLSLRAALQGDYHGDGWQGMLSQLQVVDADQAALLQLDQSVPLIVARDRVQVDDLCVRIEDGHACLSVAGQRDTGAAPSWRLQSQWQNVPLTVRKRALAPNAKLQARLNGTAQLVATADAAWQGTANAELANASIRYKVDGRERALPIRQAIWQLRADTQGINSEAELRIGEQTVSTMTISLQRMGTDISQWPLTGVLSLSSSDAKLIPVFFAAVDRADGTLAGVLQVSGSLAQPRIAGTLKLLGGGLDFYQVNLALRNLTLDATLDNDVQGDRLQLTASGATGVKGDQGQLQAAGDFHWIDAQLTGRLHINGQRMLVADLPEYHVLASPDLDFNIDKRQIKVTGEVLIPEARLKPKDVSGAVQASSDVRYVHETPTAKDSQWTVQSDVRIRMGDAVTFDGLGLQGRLTGSVLTKTRSGDAALGDGELSIEQGRYEAYSQKLDIKRGRLLYSSTALDNPGLDIQAERTINDASLGTITVGVYVRGVLRSPRLQFYSDASLTQTQIVSYLLVGKPLDSLQGQDATTVRSASNTLALQGGGYLAGQLGRRVGLEEVGVETDSNNQSSLVLGKFLSPRLFVSYGISLTETINTVKLRYTLGKHWQLKSEVGAAKSADLEFKIER